MTPYVVMRFDVLLYLFYVSTPIGDFLMVLRVYRKCPVSLLYSVTLVGL